MTRAGDKHRTVLVRADCGDFHGQRRAAGPRLTSRHASGVAARQRRASRSAWRVESAARAAAGPGARLAEGPFLALDDDWGARVGCYALVASGLRNAERLHKAAMNLQHADAAEAAWWFGLMTNSKGKRPVRALRILIEAVR